MVRPGPTAALTWPAARAGRIGSLSLHRCPAGVGDGTDPTPGATTRIAAAVELVWAVGGSVPVAVSSPGEDMSGLPGTVIIVTNATSMAGRVLCVFLFSVVNDGMFLRDRDSVVGAADPCRQCSKCLVYGS